MEWDDLKYVLAIARHGTLSEAGSSLSVSHTTVGRRLKAFEEKLGARVFDRTPEGFVATAVGADIIEVADKLEGEVLALESRILGQDAKLQGQLRVATMDVFYIRFQAAFDSFVRRYPSIELTVMSSNEPVSLVRRETDVAFRMTSNPPEYLVGRRVGKVRFAVYGAREAVEAAGPEASYADFRWLRWDKRLNLTFLDDWLDVNAPGAEVSMRIDFPSVLLREAIAQGAGVHFLSCVDGDGDPRLTRIGPIVEEFGSELWLLTLPDLRTNTRVRAFMEHMAEALEEERDAMWGEPLE